MKKKGKTRGAKENPKDSLKSKRTNRGRQKAPVFWIGGRSLRAWLMVADMRSKRYQKKNLLRKSKTPKKNLTQKQRGGGKKKGCMRPAASRASSVALGNIEATREGDKKRTNTITRREVPGHGAHILGGRTGTREVLKTRRNDTPITAFMQHWPKS